MAHTAELTLRAVFQFESSRITLQNSSRQRVKRAIEIAYTLYEKTKDASFIEKAFLIAEQSKATVLLDAIQDNLFRQEVIENDTLLAEQQSLRNAVAYYERQLIFAGEDKEKDVLKNTLSN